MSDERVIVVQEQYSGEVLTVCDSWDDYDSFVEQGAYGWEEDDLTTTDCRVKTFK